MKTKSFGTSHIQNGTTNMKTINVNDKEVKVVYPDELDSVLTEEDKEMDARAREAVRVAIEKEKFLKRFR